VVTTVAFFVKWQMTLGDLGVALGTLLLAFFTFNLGRAATRQVALQRAKEEAKTRPYVVPAPSHEWAVRNGEGEYIDSWRQRFPVKNTGQGTALNVQCMLDFRGRGGTTVRTVPTSLAGGDQEDLRVHWDAPALGMEEWSSVGGRIDFEDVVGARWQTTFQLNTENEVRYVYVKDVVQITGPSGRPLEEAGG